MYTELLIIMSVHDTVAAGMLYFKMSTYFLKNDVKLWREREREKEKKRTGIQIFCLHRASHNKKKT